MTETAPTVNVSASALVVINVEPSAQGRRRTFLTALCTRSLTQWCER